MKRLNSLEIAILSKFLEFESLPSIDLHVLNEAMVLERKFSGMGFLTKLKSPNLLRKPEFPDQFRGGNVGAKINDGNIDAGFVIYIDNGEISAIEGYDIRAEAWCKDIRNFSLYKIGYGKS